MATGDLIEFGTLLMNGKKQLFPTRPWRADMTPPGATEAGNIPNYINGESVTFGNSDSDKAYRIKCREVNIDGKRLLVPSATLLVNISHDDLKTLGFVDGKEYVIDGKRVLARLMTGGSIYRSGAGYSGGSPSNNEWDRIIANEARLSGIPSPTSTDLDTSRNSIDFNSAHNRFWNWFYVYTLVKETYARNSAYHVSRGHDYAHYFNWNTASTRYSSSGFRPVFEVLGSVPTTPGEFTSPTVGTVLKGGSAVTVTFGKSTDADGNSITYEISESVNGGAYTVITSMVSSSYARNMPTDKSKTTVKWRVRAKDSLGLYSDYRESATYTISHNSPPAISGSDINLGSKNTPFSVIYQVNDVDVENPLTVTEKLNGVTLRTLNNAPKATDIQIDITKAIFDKIELNSTNTIQVEVNDSNGGIAYRNYTFTKTNSGPIISGINIDLGVISSIPEQTYQVSDNEGDTIIITEKINGVIIRSFEATAETDYIVTIPEIEWIKLNLGQHILRVEALDSRGSKSIRTYTFTRTDDKISVELKTPFTTDIKARKILISPTWVIPTGATAKVEACNNAFDDEPTWEDITNQVLINRHYNFINETKVAENWGINIRFTLEKGTATSQVILDGFGGAFE